MTTIVYNTVVEIDAATAGLWEWQGREYDYEDEQWTWDDIQTVVARVNRGATLLDEQKPDWVSEIIPEKLDMSSGSFCIIGQVYGEYEEHIGIPFGIDVMNATNSEMTEKGIDHGFLTAIRGSSIPYELLDRVWVYMLTERSKGRPVTLSLPDTRQPLNLVVEDLIRNEILRLRDDGTLVEA